MDIYRLRHGERFGFKVERTPGFQEKIEIAVWKAVKSAISNSVRLIDIASAYGNEEEIGQAIWEAINVGIIQREDIFVKTKIYPGSEMENPIQIMWKKQSDGTVCGRRKNLFHRAVEQVCGGIDEVSAAGGYCPCIGSE